MAMTISQTEAEIERLQSEAAPKIKNLANLSYNDVYELEHRFLNPIRSLQRSLVGLRAAETRRENERKRKEAEQADKERRSR